MPQFYTSPVITVLARPAFVEPAHLPVQWLGESTDGERLAEFAGRLCYMSQKNPASRNTREYIDNIKKQGHGSVLEHANYSLLIEGVSRSLTHELVRHRAGFAYCLDGDTLIYSERKASGRRNGATKRRLRDLFAMTLTPHGRSRLKLLRLRCLDESTGTFTVGRVKTIVCSGTKPVFRVTLEDGKTIASTRDHRFLTPSGWQRLEDALGGLSISAGGLTTAGRLGVEFVVNGEPAYRNRAWLEEQYVARGYSQESIARVAGVSAHTVRAWVRKHGLQKSVGSWSRGKRPWNAGIRYAAGWKHSPETRELLATAKRGEKNPQWKGGVTPLAIRLRKGAHTARTAIFSRDGHTCRLCGVRGGRLTLHHVLPIWARPDLASAIDNIVTVCQACHQTVLNGHELEFASHFGQSATNIRPNAQPHRGGGRLLVPRRRGVVAVEYLGERETYDIEMEGPHHNFVANGIVTHNSQLSQRYVDESHAAFVVPPAIQGDDALVAQWTAQMEAAQATYVALVEKLMERYGWVADKVHRRKMAREAARGVLPNSTETKIVTTANVRGWRTMLELRTSEGAEMEIRRCAVMILRTLQAEAPGFFSDFEVYTAPDRVEAARIAYHKV